VTKSRLVDPEEGRRTDVLRPSSPIGVLIRYQSTCK
jgi:hypothetical protein